MNLLPLPAVAGALLLSACAAVPLGPDPRDEFAERNVDKTLATFVQGMGTQVVHMAPDGQLYLWSSANTNVQRGEWRYDLLATGSATTYQGAGGINVPVEELATDWGICFKYIDENGNILRRPAGGDWNCALFGDYEPLITERAEGDAFGLSGGQAPGEIPAEALLTLAQLQRL